MKKLKNPAISDEIPLPPPRTTGRRTLERVMFTRRSIRDYRSDPLTPAELAQLLWSCQGITSGEGLRTTPSAGATYPLEIYAAVHNVKGIAAGVYHYHPGPGLRKHHLTLVREGSTAGKLQRYSTTQEFIGMVPLNIIFTAVEERTRKEYGDSASQYVLLEIGHAAQNLHLQAEALGLGSVAIGYVDADKVRALLNAESEPLYMVSVGRRLRATR